ncbi:MAG: Gfo/Idh/MocA family oxidoreductase [Chloroflexi bacterium]|nr:Gfo/Idh/MocA family oxidoreductase [Chloroflexota bacterium]
MTLRIAIAGFRHGHIMDLYRRAAEHPALQLVAACEEDEATRAQLAAQGQVKITHSNYLTMLREAPCDAVAIGDYFARRGALAIAALEHGKHVISDKPLATSLAEVERITELAAANRLCVGCMLDLRDNGLYIRTRELVRQGIIGEVKAISFNGQHPLLFGSRAGWYFEPGKHGGTLNDIGIHAFDALPWITGLQFTQINAARCWVAHPELCGTFASAGQVMLTLENGCGVLGDVSYLTPDSFAYRNPQYWRMTIWGSQGVLETALNEKAIHLAVNGEGEMRCEQPAPNRPGGYLEAFLHDIEGSSAAGELDTCQVLRAASVALQVQAAADDTKTTLIV